LPLLGEMGDGPGAQLMATASVSSIAKDQEILREGATPTAMLTVLSGKVALAARSAPQSSRPQSSSGAGYAVLGLLHAGDIVMPATVVETMAYPLSAIAIEPTRIASIPIEAVRAA